MEMDESKKHTIIFLGALAGAGIIIATLVFPFWNLIREDVYEDAIILGNVDGTCFVETLDGIPKTITNCELQEGAAVKIKFGKGLAWAKIIE